MPNLSRMKAACVPLPAPGGPGGSTSCQHFTHRLQVSRRIDPRRNLARADGHGNAVAVPKDPQLLKRLDSLQRRFLQLRNPQKKTDAIRVQAGMAISLCLPL